MYKTALSRVLDPWSDFWAIDDFFRVRHPRHEGGPAISSRVTEDKVVLETELPGVAAEDVDISVKGDTLSIKGERKASEPVEGERYHLRERWHGQFARTLKLPFKVDSGKVEAAFKDGILTVTLPRAEEDKPRKIDISLN